MSKPTQPTAAELQKKKEIAERKFRNKTAFDILIARIHGAGPSRDANYDIKDIEECFRIADRFIELSKQKPHADQ